MGSMGGCKAAAGLDGYVDEISGSLYGSINNFFGDSVGHATSTSGTGFNVPLGGYGVMPGSGLPDLTSIWRSHYLDWTQFYCMGARYYDPQSGRFLSADPMGHASSMSLYDYANGDPLTTSIPMEGWQRRVR